MQLDDWVRRWRTLALSAVVGAAACARPQPPAPPGEEPRLRIGLAAGAAVTVGGDAELILAAEGGVPLGQVPAGVAYRAVRNGALVRLEGPGDRPTESASSIQAVPATEGRFAVVNGRRYRGSIELRPAGSGVVAVNIVPAESYLLGVVGAELGRRVEAEREAAKAQAIVSRTFAVKRRGLRRNEGFDLHADVRDQVYGGVEAEHPISSAAVRATAGQVLVHRGELADVFFFSTCGYQTAAVREVFHAVAERPYLRPVSDRIRGDRYYCELSPRFRWREEWDRASLRAILRSTLPPVTRIDSSDVRTVRRVRVAETGRSGRVTELAIQLEAARLGVRGPDVRSVLRPVSDRVLGSTAFQLYETVENGEVSRLVAAGAGWGHGVGFCQWGAVGRARAGQDYRAIVGTYFPGTTVARAY